MKTACKHKFDTVVEWEYGVYTKVDPQTDEFRFARQKDFNVKRATKVICSTCLEVRSLF